MQNTDFSHVTITGGLWKEKQTLLRTTTARAIYDRFRDTGRIGAFGCAWREGMPHRPHVFWDSDVAKWIEGVAYLTETKREPELEALCDDIIDNLVAHQTADGYYNSYFLTVEPGARFTRRGEHELYCAGHLMEAAVAYYRATGKRKLLDAMCRYADYIDRRFRVERNTGFVTPGHEEIELALVRLSECTGEGQYLALAKFFLDERGKRPEPLFTDGTENPLYHQSHRPVREQTEAEGHAVRAVYLYCAMADVAEKTGDEGLLAACRALFDDIVTKKMFVTGGIGSSSCGEAFTVAYDLPNLLAYTESCAALGLALFAGRMQKTAPDSRYADTVERVLYNGFLSSLSLDGKSFFYENPLEVIPYLPQRDKSRSVGAIHWPQSQRSEVFDCSCCPPNILRFIASIGNFLYSTDADTLYVQQYMASKADVVVGGRTLHVTQKTRYPESGRVHITVTGGDVRLAVRVPGWCDSYAGPTERGYAYFDVKDGETVTPDFGMKARLVEARPEAVFDCGRYAVMRGPVVYCMEGIDNGEFLRDVRIDARARFAAGRHPTLGVPMLTVRAWRRETAPDTPLYSARRAPLAPFRATFIPYYAFANRGPSAMQVWTGVK